MSVSHQRSAGALLLFTLLMVGVLTANQLTTERKGKGKGHTRNRLLQSVNTASPILTVKMPAPLPITNSAVGNVPAPTANTPEDLNAMNQAFKDTLTHFKAILEIYASIQAALKSEVNATKTLVSQIIGGHPNLCSELPTHETAQIKLETQFDSTKLVRKGLELPFMMELKCLLFEMKLSIEFRLADADLRVDLDVCDISADGVSNKPPGVIEDAVQAVNDQLSDNSSILHFVLHIVESVMIQFNGFTSRDLINKAKGGLSVAEATVGASSLSQVTVENIVSHQQNILDKLKALAAMVTQISANITSLEAKVVQSITPKQIEFLKVHLPQILGFFYKARHYLMDRLQKETLTDTEKEMVGKISTIFMAQMDNLKGLMRTLTGSDDKTNKIVQTVAAVVTASEPTGGAAAVAA